MFPSGKFDVVLAHPQWKEEDPHVLVTSAGEELSHPQLLSLNVPKSEMGLFFIWISPADLPAGLELLGSLKFKYAGNLVLVKEVDEPVASVKDTHEHILFGGKASTPFPEQALSSSVIRCGKNSVADTVYEMVEGVFKNGNRLLLFDHTDRPGWSTWP